MDRPNIHFLLEEFVIIATVFLGMVHRRVGTLDQGFRVFSVIGVDTDTDADADMQIVLIDNMRRHQRYEHLLRRQGRVFCVLNKGEQQ